MVAPAAAVAVVVAVEPLVEPAILRRRCHLIEGCFASLLVGHESDIGVL